MSEVVIVVLILIAIFATGFAFGSLFWPRYDRWRRARRSEKISDDLLPAQPPMPRPLPDHEYRPRSPYAPRRPQPSPSKPNQTATATRDTQMPKLPPINWGKV